MTPPKVKYFGAYRAEMCEFDDVIDCHIEGPNHEGGSLALAMGTGCLTSRDHKFDVPIPMAIVEQIEKWALTNGY
jgi:hypothetical protein